MRDWQRIVVNALVFNAGWFACVLSARWGAPLAAAPVIMAALLLHVLVITPRSRRLGEGVAIVCVAAIGTGIDTLNLSLGILGFAGSVGVFVPWIACFWLNFATTLNTSLRWLAPRPVLAGVLGVISAPGTYFFGAKLGALTLYDPAWVSMFVLGGQWLLMLPAMALLARRLRRGRGDTSERPLVPLGSEATASAERPAS